MAKQKGMYKVFNDFNKKLISEEDVFQYTLALLSEYCETHVERDMVRWLQTVGLQHRDMRVTTPKSLREQWSRNQYACMMTNSIDCIVDWRREPTKCVSKILTDVYYEMETYVWGRDQRITLHQHEKTYCQCLKVGKEITQPLPEITPLILLERTDQQTLRCASDELEAAGFEKSAAHLRSGQKHVWTCSVFKGILGTV